MIGEKALEIAISQLGVEEKPRNSNSGPEVTMYLRSVGLNAGQAWCMAFVYWSVNSACSLLGKLNPLIKTGGVMLQYRNVKLRTLPKTSSSVKPGDVFVMEFSHGRGHTGFVKKIENGIVYTIEGNTNDDGSREGYEVAERQRPLSEIHGFIQLP